MIFADSESDLDNIINSEDEDFIYDSDHDTQSELDEEEDILAETDNKLKYYLAKNKITQWKKDLPNQRIRTRQQNIVIDQPGVKEYGKLADTPEKCFDLFITPKMIEEIIYHTNQKIKIVSQNYNQCEGSTKEVYITEFKALLGILYLAGIFKSNHQNMSDLWKSDGFGIDIFRVTMPLKRFRFLIHAMRFDDILTSEERKVVDKATHIRNIFQDFVDMPQILYNIRICNPR
ncbi:uncharacterized protein LOC135923914 [Gordionus sp. m RMFG-2023]|uniref:uncharacterized protein LOC135923914 n=1 Tax=Gordionus sp. m RMFG-2023 TaxID=3053472 RepID=UPI0031FC9E9C